MQLNMEKLNSDPILNASIVSPTDTPNALTSLHGRINTRFIVPKEKERAEILLQQGVGGFQFKKGEKYIFKYSFRAKEGMKVSGSSTRFGQMKGVSDGFQLLGNPLYSVTANNNGINVRFNNEDSDRVEGMDEFLSWEDAAGEWVHVQITTTFGKSMDVSKHSMTEITPTVQEGSSAGETNHWNYRSNRNIPRSYVRVATVEGPCV